MTFKLLICILTLMRKYELVIILDSDMGEDERKKITTRVEKIVADSQGKLEKVDEWGKREFAYQFNKLMSGFYYFFLFSTDPDQLPIINRKMRLEEKVIRYLLVNNEEKTH